MLSSIAASATVDKIHWPLNSISACEGNPLPVVGRLAEDLSYPSSARHARFTAARHGDCLCGICPFLFPGVVTKEAMSVDSYARL